MVFGFFKKKKKKEAEKEKDKKSKKSASEEQANVKQESIIQPNSSVNKLPQNSQIEDDVIEILLN